MNYQNNIDAYYAYAKENHKRRKREERSTWLWLIGSILVLFGVWAYFSNLNLLNGFGNEAENSKNNLSKMVLDDDTSKKDEVSQNIKVSQNNNVMRNDTISKEIEINKKRENRVEREKTPFDLNSKKDMHSNKDMNINKDMNSNKSQLSSKSVPQNIGQETVTIVPVAVVNGNDVNSTQTHTQNVAIGLRGNENIPMGLREKSEINGSSRVEENTLVQGRELNSSVEENIEPSKVVNLEENSSINLYHIYIVSKGENIYDIARKEYGDTQMYVEIVNANKDLENPNKIREGQELFLPIVNESKSYKDILHFK